MARTELGYFSSNRKYRKKFSQLFWAISLFICTLLFIRFLLVSSLQKQADLTYGKWSGSIFDISEQDLRTIETNPMIESVSEQFIQGVVVEERNNLEKQFGAIGTISDNFPDMANLSFKTGNYPRAKNEVAVEAQSLDAMGISYELGQILDLNIRTDEDTVISRSFVLCGVLENYTDTWSSDGELLHFITGSPVSEQSIIHVFIEPDRYYPDVINTIRIPDHPMMINTDRQISRDPFSTINLPVSVAVILTILLSALLTFEMVISWIWKNSNEIRLLRIVGIHSILIQKDVGRMLWIVGRWPLILLSLALIISVSFWFAVMLILLLLVLLFLISKSACMLIRRIDLKRSSKYSDQTSASSEIRRQNSVLTTREIADRYLQKQKRTRMISVCCLIFLQCVFLFSGSSLIKSATNLAVMMEYRVDYQISGREIMLNSFISDFGLIPDSVVDEIRNLSGIESDREVRRRKGISVSWDNMDQSLVTDPETGSLITIDTSLVHKDGSGQEQLYPWISEISDPDEINELKNGIDEGSVNWEQWIDGKEAIVVLPRMSIDDSGLFNPSIEGQIDESIQPGDILQLNHNGVLSSVRVGGILRQTGENYSAYEILMAGKDINRIDLILKDEKNRVPLETRLSQLAAQHNLRFINQYSNNTYLLTSILMSICIQLFVLLSAISISVFILSLLRLQNCSSVSRYLKQLSRIGLPRSICTKIQNMITGNEISRTILFELLIAAMFLLWNYFDKRGNVSNIWATMKQMTVFSGSVFILMLIVSFLYYRKQER